MLQWALTPADDATLRLLTERGESDAAAWAHLTGVLQAACPDPDDWYRCGREVEQWPLWTGVDVLVLH